MTWPLRRNVLYIVLIAVTLMAVRGVGSAAAVEASDVRNALTDEQYGRYQVVAAAQVAHAQRLTAYWSVAEAKRTMRREKRQAGVALFNADFVTTHPPHYLGPPMPKDIASVLARLAGSVAPNSETLPTVSEILASARSNYDFTPSIVTELEFKWRYAAAALAIGLSKDQVVRVYALETGGLGTYDMQSGIHPITRNGRPISTALGYAQLLAANSISELVKHGDVYIRLLEEHAVRHGITAVRRRALRHKVGVVRSMLREARSVPNEWKQHVELAKTDRGLGIHALNLDGDIGPELQIRKLHDLLLTARRELNRAEITGGELELMNLAGPRNGLDMLTEPGRRTPTANFFTRGGYTRNPVVHDRTGHELLLALEQRIDVHITKPGAIAFEAAFNSLMHPSLRPRLIDRGQTAAVREPRSIEELLARQIGRTQ